MNLDPLRNTLLSAAAADADAITLAATTEAAEKLSIAEAQVANELARARAEADAAAAGEALRIAGRARSNARQAVLRAQRNVYDELRMRVVAAALELRHDPEYDELLERLQDRARELLGESATVEIDPPGVGGVRASSGSRHVDLSLPALAERSLASLGPDLELIWR
jgi:vacuolar-type H+-ATPase subunit E/Vma4